MAEHDDLIAAVTELAAPIADRHEVELLDVVVKGPRGRRLVRITLDLIDPEAEGDLDVDTIASVTRELSKALDESDPIDGRYTFEVTSPGTDRPLRSPRDFRRNLGRDVRIERDLGADEREELTGRLAAASEDQITLEIDGQDHDVPLGTITSARVVLPW